MGRVTAHNLFPTFGTTVTLCAATERNAGFVKSLNTYLRGIFPGISWTAIAIVHGDGHRPMTLHVHIGVDSALSAELCVGDLQGGGVWTGGGNPCSWADTRRECVVWKMSCSRSHCGSARWCHIQCVVPSLSTSVLRKAVCHCDVHL